VNTAEAYRHCEELTRSRAANFFYGIRLLPPEKRRALCAVYAMARRIDDIGDGAVPNTDRRRLLEEARTGLARIRPASQDPVLAALGDAGSRFDLPLSAFSELIDGVEMDVAGERYATFDALEVYCRRVAGSIGRLSVAVFGPTSPEQASRLADDLGVAMQLTNILRDIREDLGRGRVYLPAEDLRTHGLDAAALEDARASGTPPLSLASVVRFEVVRAREWFDRGLRLLPLLDSRSRSCVSAMTGIYRRILDRLDRHPEEVMRRRVSLPPWEKAWVAARSLARVGS
jgi:phytoene synthase